MFIFHILLSPTENSKSSVTQNCSLAGYDNGRGDLAHTTCDFMCSGLLKPGTGAGSLLREKQRKELEQKISEVLVLLIHHYKLP